MMEKMAHRRNQLRVKIDDLVSNFNKIAFQPYEELEGAHEILEDLPIFWDLNQVYFNIESLRTRIDFPPVCVAFVDRKMELIDIVVLEFEQLDRSSQAIPNNDCLTINHFFIRDDLFESEEIQKIKHKIIYHETVESDLADFLKRQYNIEKCRVFAFPDDIRNTLIDLKIPSFNRDVLGALSRLLELRYPFEQKTKTGKISPGKYYFSYLSYEDTYFDFLRFLLSRWRSVDHHQWSVILTTLLDDLLMNMVVVSDDYTRVLAGFKLLVDHNQMKINPLPISVFKGILPENPDASIIAKMLYERTGLRTQVLQDGQLLEYIKNFMDPQFGIYDFILSIFELVYSSKWYPDSLLNSFLKLFGLELGSGMTRFRKAFQTVMNYFETVLFVTFQDNIDDENKPYEALVQLKKDNGKSTIQLIDTNDFKGILRQPQADKVQRLYMIKDAVEKQRKIHYSACFGFNIDIFSEYFSIKNIQAFLNMATMAHQLPFIATLGALFIGMKGMNADDKDHPIIQRTEKVPDPEFVKNSFKMANYLEGFLKKGILFIADDDKSMKRIRSPIYSADGYLGLDLDILKQLNHED